MQLYEKYRPKALDDFIGQCKVKRQLQAIMKRPGFDRDAFWIQGVSGTGKTSLAWIIARQLADDFEIQEIDGDDCSVQKVREIEQNISMCPMIGTWRVWIINEAHAITGRAVQGWLTLLERIPANRLIIFTTTESIQGADLFGNFSNPYARRCKVLQFTNQGLAQDMAERAKAIAQAENLDGKPIGSYVRLVQECKNNLGMVLQRIEQGDMLV